MRAAVKPILPWHGEEHPSAKLTEDAVRAIRADTRRLREVAQEHGVSEELVRLIRRRERWAHVTDTAPVEYPDHRRGVGPALARD
jgi:hypothetical protein